MRPLEFHFAFIKIVLVEPLLLLLVVVVVRACVRVCVVCVDQSHPGGHQDLVCLNICCLGYSVNKLCPNMESHYYLYRGKHQAWGGQHSRKAEAYCFGI